MKDFGVEEGTAGGGERFCAHDGDRDGEGGEHDKGHHAGGPAEANPRLKLVKDYWVDDAPFGNSIS